jgi:hypothetical protein
MCRVMEMQADIQLFVTHLDIGDEGIGFKINTGSPVFVIYPTEGVIDPDTDAVIHATGGSQVIEPDIGVIKVMD